jgi:hypothetical protein
VLREECQCPTCIAPRTQALPLTGMGDADSDTQAHCCTFHKFNPTISGSQDELMDLRPNNRARLVPQNVHTPSGAM